MCLLCAAAAAGATHASLVAARVAAFPGPTQLPEVPHLVASFVRPVLFSAFGLKVYNYGLFVASALLVALIVFAFEVKRAKLPLDHMEVFWFFFAGFAGGSKAHLALQALVGGEPLTWRSAVDLRSGHSFIGSQIGAVGCSLLLIRLRGVGLFDFLDVLLPCCLLGHAIGKMGCFMSGDGCYGPVADPQRVPWAMSFPFGGVPTLQPVHPTPLYEGGCSFLIFWLARRLLPMPQPAMARGRRTALVLVLYGIERVCVEQVRQHPPIDLFLGLTEYQALALGLLAIGLIIELVVRRRRHLEVGGAEQEGAQQEWEEEVEKKKKE